MLPACMPRQLFLGQPSRGPLLLRRFAAGATRKESNRPFQLAETLFAHASFT